MAALRRFSIWCRRGEALRLQRKARALGAYADVYAGMDRVSTNGKTYEQAADFFNASDAESGLGPVIRDLYFAEPVLLTFEGTPEQWRETASGL